MRDKEMKKDKFWLFKIHGDFWPTGQQRYGDFISVKRDFIGAKGDGLTDDSEAIQKATELALKTIQTRRKASNIYYPKGIYSR